MPEVQGLAGAPEDAGHLAAPVVAHHAPHRRAPGGEPGDTPVQERGAGGTELVREHLDVGDTTMVVDRDVHVLPPDPPRAPASVPVHPMPHPLDPPERLDV